MPSTLYNPDGTRTGLRINARSRRTKHMGGEPRGGLFNQPTKSEQVAISERARARRDAAASMPSTAAVKAAPAKPQADGMLVPGPSGSSVWKTKAELDEQRKTKEMADASRRAGANTGGGMFGTVMRGVKKGFDAAKKNVAEIDTAKRKAFSRWRVQSEAYINDPKWAEGSHPKEAAQHRASLMKTMAKEKTRNEFMDYPPWYGKNVPSKTPQTAREWDEVGRKPFY